MKSPLRQLILIVLLVVWLPTADLAAQTSNVDQASDEVLVDGLVLERQKYSFTLQANDQIFKVSIPNGTPMLMKLTNPEFDFTNNRVSYSLICSARDGKTENDVKLSWPLPTPTIVSSMFRSEQEMQATLSSGLRKLDRYVISEQPMDVGPFSISGELSAGTTEGQFYVDSAGSVRLATLGPRKGLLHGFTISDLKPMQTSVWVQGQMEGDTLVARRIRFEYLGDPNEDFDTSLPTLLSLGDITSQDYQRSLIESLSGKVNVHHPPRWLGPSKNWNRLHHYVGKLDAVSPQWDAIAFNFGIRDHNTPRETYQQNLRQAIQVLQRTGSKLIWVNSTPLPNGLPEVAEGVSPEGMVQGRMKLQNLWANEVLSEFSDIAVCDLWKVAESEVDGVLKGWWSRQNFYFDYQRSIPLGRALAEKTIQVLNVPGQINPPSVHQPSDTVNASR